MTAPAGISGQLGFKSEASVGTAVTVDQFHPGLLSEAIKTEITPLISQGIRAGRRVHYTWKQGARTIGGSINLELWDQPLATLLTHMFGDVATVGDDPYTHTATPADLTGKSLTIQIGRPDVGGTVRAFTYAGVKIASWELSCAVDEIATLNLELSAQTETTDTSLAEASYPSAAPFVFTEGSLAIASSAVATVSNVSMSGNNTLAVDRHRFGSAAVKEQLENGFREYTGSVEADFESLTAYNRFVNGTEAALVLEFDNGTQSLTITANVMFTGETPELSGPETLTQNLPFQAISVTSDAAAVTAVLVNSESSAD